MLTVSWNFLTSMCLFPKEKDVSRKIFFQECPHWSNVVGFLVEWS